MKNIIYLLAIPVVSLLTTRSGFAASVRNNYGELDNRTSECARNSVDEAVNGWMSARNPDGTPKNRSSNSRYKGIYEALQICGVIPAGKVPGPLEISSYFRRSTHFDNAVYLSVQLPDSQSVTYELTGEPGSYVVGKIDRVKFSSHLSTKPAVEKTIFPEAAVDDDRREVALEYRHHCARAQKSDERRLAASPAARESAELVKLISIKMGEDPTLCSIEQTSQLNNYRKELGVDANPNRAERTVNGNR